MESVVRRVLVLYTYVVLMNEGARPRLGAGDYDRWFVGGADRERARLTRHTYLHHDNFSYETHDDVWVRANVAAAYYCPPDVLSRLAVDRHPAVRNAAASNHSLPDQLRAQRLEIERNETVRTTLLSPPVPVEVSFACDLSFYPAAPGGFELRSLQEVPKYLTHEPELIEALERLEAHARLLATTYSQSELDGPGATDVWSRIWLARQPTTDETTLLVLVGDRCEQVRATVASNPRLPRAGLERLLWDDEPFVWQQVVARPDLPDDLRSAAARAGRG